MKFAEEKATTKNSNDQEKKIQYEIFDIPTDGVNEDIKAYLKFGPDFSEAPRKLPYNKVIIETERMCKIIEKGIDLKPEQAYDVEKESHRLHDIVKKLLLKAKNNTISQI